MFFESYIEQAGKIFSAYSLQQPLSIYLKTWFSKLKHLGARDRRMISDILYGVYRLGNGNTHLSFREKTAIGALLSDSMPVGFYHKCFPEFIGLVDLSFEEKLNYLQEQMHLNLQIPWSSSEGFSEQEFIRALFVRPRVFMRLRRNRDQLLQMIREKNIEFKIENEQCISVEQGVKLEELLPGTDYVIQDISSQTAGNYFAPADGDAWWDCCVASGGKSIQLLDKNARIDLTVSDIRKNILQNMELRLRKYYPVQKFKTLETDLTGDISDLRLHLFDQIICDVPCSGSGTWRRSPEQYYFFTREKSDQYQQKQKSLLSNVLTFLKPGGTLYYITCSILIAENENVVNAFAGDYDIETHSLNSFQQGGDGMFIALIRHKPINRN